MPIRITPASFMPAKFALYSMTSRAKGSSEMRKIAQLNWILKYVCIFQSDISILRSYFNFVLRGIERGIFVLC